MTPKSSGGRKSNSLGVLVAKIVSRFPKIPAENEVWEMSVPDLQREFNAKATIYEVLVILESVLMVI